MSPNHPGDRRESQTLRPTTKVLTQGFDPSLSVGSARPAVFRSSTYVFPSPEAAERAFDIASGRAPLPKGETTDLIYSRFNHPNAQILEDQIVNLEADATAALAFNSGMAAIVSPTRASAPGAIHRLHCADLRRHAALHSGSSFEMGRRGNCHSRRSRRSADESDRLRKKPRRC